MLRTILILILVSLVLSQRVKRFQLLNSYDQEIWVGFYGTPSDAFSTNGLILKVGEKKDIETQGNEWQGFIWARTGCNHTTNTCITGDCGEGINCRNNPPILPVTKAEFTFSKMESIADIYAISLADGFNIPMTIQPVNGEKIYSSFNCGKVGCVVDLVKECPQDLRVTKNGRNVACTTACLKYNTKQFCCTDTDFRQCVSQHWAIDYPRYFKDRCPYVKAFHGDRSNYIEISNYICVANTYIIIFG